MRSFGFAFTLFIAFSVGFSLAYFLKELEISHFIADIDKDTAKNNELVAEKEQSLVVQALRSSNETQKAIASINADYDKYINELNNGVHNKNTAYNNSEMPTATEAIKRTSERTSQQLDKHVKTSTKDIKAIKKRLLEMAKQHDELVIKYNELYDLYTNAIKAVDETNYINTNK